MGNDEADKKRPGQGARSAGTEDEAQVLHGTPGIRQGVGGEARRRQVADQGPSSWRLFQESSPQLDLLAHSNQRSQHSNSRLQRPAFPSAERVVRNGIWWEREQALQLTMQLEERRERGGETRQPDLERTLSCQFRKI